MSEPDKLASCSCARNCNSRSIARPRSTNVSKENCDSRSIAGPTFHQRAQNKIAIRDRSPAPFQKRAQKKIAIRDRSRATRSINVPKPKIAIRDRSPAIVLYDQSPAEGALGNSKLEYRPSATQNSLSASYHVTNAQTQQLTHTHNTLQQSFCFTVLNCLINKEKLGLRPIQLKHYFMWLKSSLKQKCTYLTLFPKLISLSLHENLLFLNTKYSTLYFNIQHYYFTCHFLNSQMKLLTIISTKLATLH
jgi:hypothetical protein